MGSGAVPARQTSVEKRSKINTNNDGQSHQRVAEQPTDLSVQRQATPAGECKTESVLSGENSNEMATFFQNRKSSFEMGNSPFFLDCQCNFV